MLSGCAVPVVECMAAGLADGITGARAVVRGDSGCAVCGIVPDIVPCTAFGGAPSVLVPSVLVPCVVAPCVAAPCVVAPCVVAPCARVAVIIPHDSTASGATSRQRAFHGRTDAKRKGVAPAVADRGKGVMGKPFRWTGREKRKESGSYP